MAQAGALSACEAVFDLRQFQSLEVRCEGLIAVFSSCGAFSYGAFPRWEILKFHSDPLDRAPGSACRDFPVDRSALLLEAARAPQDYEISVQAFGLFTFLESRAPAVQGGFQAGQTAKARRGPPCAVTPSK